MKTFTLEEMLDALVAFEMALNPEIYPSAKELTPEDFIDAAICKAAELGIEKEFKKARKNYIEIPIENLNKYRKKDLLR